MSMRLDRRKKKIPQFPQEKHVIADVTIRMPITIAIYPEELETDAKEACQSTVDYLFHEHFDYSDTYLTFARFAHFMSKWGSVRQRKTRNPWKWAEYGNFKIRVVHTEETEHDKEDRALFREWLNTPPDCDCM